MDGVTFIFWLSAKVRSTSGTTASGCRSSRSLSILVSKTWWSTCSPSCSLWSRTRETISESNTAYGWSRSTKQFNSFTKMAQGTKMTRARRVVVALMATIWADSLAISRCQPSNAWNVKYAGKRLLRLGRNELSFPRLSSTFRTEQRSSSTVVEASLSRDISSLLTRP